MTNKEAKEKLYMEWQKFLEDNIDYAGISKAYQTAFKALDQEPSNDMVSRGVFEQVMWERDVAIEQLKELGYELGEKIHTTTAGEGEVMYYPQVEGVTPTVVSTEKQEPFDEYGNYKYPSDFELTEPNMATSMPCGDAISRQAVLDIVDNYSESQSNVEDVTQDIISDIVVLQPVNPEPKTGHWTRELIRNEKGGCIGAKMICSECGKDNKHDEYMNYCPNCGAKMRKRSDKK